MDARVAYSLLTLIQDRAASVLTLAAGAPLPELRVVGSLLEQIRNPKTVTPEGLVLGLTGLLDKLSVLDALGDGDSPGFLGKLRDQVGDLGRGFLDGKGVEAVRGLLDNLWSARSLVQGGVGQKPIGALLRRQLGLGISFVTTLRNLADLDLVDRIPEGWTQYFFAEKGFETVDGIPIVPPAHGELLAALQGVQSVAGLKGLLKERSGEHYVRDLVRITVEVAGDLRYNDLRARHAKLLEQVGTDENRAKAARWFKGAASMAESMVTGAVEEACLGVAAFQTNALIAAAAATYAGTAARKATQHVFLSQLGV